MSRRCEAALPGSHASWEVSAQPMSPTRNAITELTIRKYDGLRSPAPISSRASIARTTTSATG